MGMKGSKAVLDGVRIASPCRAEWGEMKGDDRVRFCSLCERHVYNLSAMSADEASGLVERAEGRLCVRFYRRRDGSMLTADCPVGVWAARRGLVLRVAGGVLIGLAFLVARGWRPRLVPIPSGPGVSARDWGAWALEVLDLRSRLTVAAGGICTMPMPITPPPPPAPSGAGAQVP